MTGFSVAKNTSYLTVASVMQKIISFLYFTFVARMIGAENVGHYFFAIVFSTLFTVFSDFGFASVLTREAAKKPEYETRYFSTVFWSKFLFGIFAYFLIFFVVNLLGYSAIIKNLVYLSALTVVFDNLHSVFYSLLRARKNLIFESIGMVGSQIVTLIFGSIALLCGLSVFWLVAAYTLASLLNLIYIYIISVSFVKIKIRIFFDKAVFKLFFVIAIPFAIAGILGRLYSYSDTIIMSKLLSAQEMGWWSVPYKITFAFQFVAVSLAASVYPVFSSLISVDKNQVSRLFEKSWRYLFAIILPIICGIFSLATPIIYLLYGSSYQPSIMTFRILLLSLLFSCLSLVNGALLNATNHQKTQTKLIFIALLVNLILNIYLIPIYGILGAAISAFAGNFVLVFGGLLRIRSFLQINLRMLFVYFISPFCSAVIMGVCVYFIYFYINLYFAIVAGVGLYFLLLYLFGGISFSEYIRVKQKIFS